MAAQRGGEKRKKSLPVAALICTSLNVYINALRNLFGGSV